MGKEKTAAFIIIGNEILSGRTMDKNLNFLATNLNELGINLKECRVVRDEEDKIIEAVNTMRLTYDYVFTSGGIGPTHDDITAASVAKAFNTKLSINKEAENILIKHYQDKLNNERLKMAYIPEGASLLDNPVTSAPGFKIENVFVFAGVPKIMQAMFAAAKNHLVPGLKQTSISISAYVSEGDIAAYLSKLQEKYYEVEIGSYPFMREHKNATSIVFRSTNKELLNEAVEDYQKHLQQINSELIHDLSS